MAELIDAATAAITEEMQAKGYEEGTIDAYTRLCSRLKKFCAERGCDYTEQIGSEFAMSFHKAGEGGLSAKYLSTIARLIRIVNAFIATDKVDLSVAKALKPVPHSGSFARLLGTWDADMRERGLAAQTVAQFGRFAVKYLLYLEKLGISELADAPRSSVSGFLVQLASSGYDTESIRGAVSSLRPFLRFSGMGNLADSLNGLRLERKRAILPTLTHEQIESVYATLDSGRVSARDKAVMLLALTTGLRGSDIAALKLDDIEWASDRISIVQQKTKNPLALPLLPAVGNAIGEYLLSERPDSDDRRLFLRALAPCGGFAHPGSIYSIIKKVFSLARVEAAGYGTRMTRHNAASRLLTAGASSPTISAVLGHADPESTDTYISTDSEGMRTCVLPLPKSVLAPATGRRGRVVSPFIATDAGVMRTCVLPLPKAVMA